MKQIATRFVVRAVLVLSLLFGFDSFALASFSDLNNNSIADSEESNVVASTTASLPAGEYFFHNLTITNNATIVAMGDQNSSSTFKGVKIVADNLTVSSGSSISANGQGYSQGPGYVPGVPSSSYGGVGAGSNASSTYGSAVKPVDLGSGLEGYRGGGAVSIVVTDTFANEGVISANGGGYRSSGGSIYVNTNKFSGAGSFTASGAGYYWPYWGPGGGGRIAVHYASSTFAGSAVGAGTAAFFDVTNNDVYIKNSFRFQKNDEPLNYHNIYLTNGASVEIEKGATLTANSISLAGASHLAISDGATINTPNITATDSSDVSVGVNVVVNVPSVTIGLGSKLTLQSEDPFTVNSLTLKDGGKIAPAQANKPIALLVDTLDVATSSSISTWTSMASSTPETFFASGVGASVYIKSSGKLTINGSISANAPAGNVGGGIYIDANELVGVGTINANGGSMVWGGYYVGYLGPYSGGQVAVYYKTSSYTGSATAPGACGSYDGWSKVCAGNGTVVMKQLDAPCTVDCFSNIMFLPGLEASRLYRPDYNGGTKKLWEPSGDDDARELLMLDSTGTLAGTATRGDIYTKDVIGTAYIPIKGNAYSSFLDQLNSMKNSEKVIADYSVIPYDWRLSLGDVLSSGHKFSDGRIYYTGVNSATTSPYIIEELHRLAKGSRTGKVTIIAHSHGGLLAKELTNILGPEAPQLIDKIILIAVPQAGTPKAVGAILHGFDQALPVKSLSPLGMSESAARNLAQNMPSAYNLVPSANYFTYVDDPIVTFSDQPLLAGWRAKYGDIIHSAERLRTFLVDQSRPVLSVTDAIKFPISGNQTLLERAEVIHNNPTDGLDNWTPPTGVALTEIAGWGMDTLKTIRYYQGSQSVCASFRADASCAYYSNIPVLEYDPQTTPDGDGTVVTPSAVWTSLSAGGKKYWVNLNNYGSSNLGTTINRKHADILEVPSLRTLLQNIVTNNEGGALPDYISATPLVSTDMEKRLHFKLHSPLSLDLHDDFGNHTGFSTTTNMLEENIPGSYYTMFGEVKYISVPASTNLRLSMNGYASGSFTLNVDEVVGENIVASTTFAGVPSSTSTVATMSFVANGGIAEASPLVVSENGNGTPELVLEPKIGGIALPDTVAPVTSIALSGTLGNNNYYTSDITVTLSAVDNAITGEISSGVTKTEYSLDGEMTWITYAAPFTIATEGTNTIMYRSVDGLGNQEQLRMEVVNLDMTAPTIFASDVSAEQLTLEGTTLTIPATVEDIIDANPTLTADVPLTQTFAPGVTNIHLTAKDIAGNIATSSIAVTVYSSPTADPDGDDIPNQDDVKPFDATVFANLIIPSEYALWEKESFDLPFSVAGKGDASLTLSNTYYRVGTSPVKDSTGVIIPAAVTTTDGVITVLFSQSTKELKTYTLTLTTTKGNTKERDSIKKKRDHETDNERRHELEKELDFASAPITLSITNTTANKTTSQVSIVNIYDKQQTAQLQYKYKDTTHSTTLLLKSDDVLKLKKGQPLELTVKVTGIKKDVPFTSSITGNFTILNVVQEEEHDNDSDRKQTKFSLFYPQSTTTTEEAITITTTVNGITQTDVVGVRFEE